MSNIILSFDCGVRNLSYCKIRCLPQGIEILEWELKNIGKCTAEALVKALPRSLFEDVTMVLVEKQLRKNTACTVLMHYLECISAIYCPKATVKRVDARVRLDHIGYVKNSKLSTAQQYAARKDACVKYTLEVLANSKWLSKLNTCTKKDDLCDAFTQACVFV